MIAASWRAARVGGRMQFAPLHVGAYSSGDFDFQGQLHYTAGARRHEYGTRNAAAVVALAEAARFPLAIGRERVAAPGAALVAQVRTGLDGAIGQQQIARSRAPGEPARGGDAIALGGDADDLFWLVEF